MIKRFIELYRAVMWHKNRTSFWDGIKSEVRTRLAWNVVYTGAILFIAGLWHAVFFPIGYQEFGILLVGMGAIKLASVSARVHIGKFIDTSGTEKSRDRKLTEEYYPITAGNVVDVLFGFSLVASGFIIRVGADFANL